MRTVLLLIASNSFMTTAWYGHLKFREQPILLVIAVSWLIALPEYALQVPANRWGYGTFTATQLKIIQEAISLGVFVAFAWFYLGEWPNWRTAIAMILVLLAVALVRGGEENHPPQNEGKAAATQNSDPPPTTTPAG